MSAVFSTLFHVVSAIKRRSTYGGQSSAILFGRMLILLPIAAGAILRICHRDTLFMLIGGTVLLEMFLGGLGWFMPWMAGQCKERARQMGATL